MHTVLLGLWVWPSHFFIQVYANATLDDARVCYRQTHAVVDFNAAGHHGRYRVRITTNKVNKVNKVNN